MNPYTMKHPGTDSESSSKGNDFVSHNSVNTTSVKEDANVSDCMPEMPIPVSENDILNPKPSVSKPSDGMQHVIENGPCRMGGLHLLDFDVAKSLGKSLDLRAEYAWVPPLCEHCKTFGHFTKVCSKNVDKVDESNANSEVKSNINSRKVNEANDNDGWQNMNEVSPSRMGGLHLLDFDVAKSLGKSLDLRAEYAWVPPLCEHCKTFGHFTKVCSKNVDKVDESNANSEVKSNINSRKVNEANDNDGWQNMNEVSPSERSNSKVNEDAEKSNVRNGSGNEKISVTNRFDILAEENDNGNSNMRKETYMAELIKVKELQWEPRKTEVDLFLLLRKPLIEDLKDIWTDDMMEFFLARCEEITSDEINGHYNEFGGSSALNEVEEESNGAANFMVQNVISNDSDASMTQVHGLTQTSKQDEVKLLIREEAISMCAIIETRLRKKSVNSVCENVNEDWLWVLNAVESRKGCRIIVGWDRNVIGANLITQTDQDFRRCLEILVEHSVKGRAEYSCR
ncbi:RNA-directed DNA polymerase, eukaryota, reverse transcriptase zinc-binding domain protein [Tanacetum coccineum]